MFRSPAFRACAALALLAAAAASHAVGFDCRRARTQVEKTICADAELSRLDSEMNDLYRQIRAETRGVDGETGRRVDPIAAENARWLEGRNECHDAACIRDAYQQRIAQMRRDWGDALTPTQAAAAPAKSKNDYRYDRHGDFKIFIADLRKAVAADDRAAVAKMIAQPFADFSRGSSCLPGNDPCDEQQRKQSASARSEAEAIAKYDRIVTASVRSALKANRVRAYSRKLDSGEDENGEVQAPGVIEPGEYLLENDDATQQRVFKRVNGVYKLQRIPFYS
ncbi:DUF1311 domain-containing protein [Lysobacter sp. K5869]|uniref:lysozyme inhibitor LprI family protein n=1 Tax=Lysobacter sp. K5869 TaxID=2820808 RepID=UPI001C060454|nr:lysozyme inhibitor LprI family protein [Lysobacter sp. K5869]QWP77710.1 DUF1311 domain-containing protein [Lysobacter sp. K5869]